MIQKQYKAWVLIVFGVLLGAVIFNLRFLSAAEFSTDNGVDESALVQQVKEAVMEELLDSDFLQKEIDA